MDALIIVAKLLVTMALLVCFIVGVWKADSRSHNPAYPALAEYATGFIMCALSLVGFYYVWIN